MPRSVDISAITLDDLLKETEHTLSMDSVFYVYEHWRPDRNEPFYVGKGRRTRAFLMLRRNPHHNNIQAKLKAMGLSVEVKLVAQCVTEREAFDIEVSRIAHWTAKGIRLTNKTLGGEGVSGLKFSDEHRRKISEAGKGRVMGPMSDTQKALISATKTGKPNLHWKPHTEETKRQISESRKGQPSPMKGRKWTPEEIEKIKQALVGKKRYAADNPFYGKTHSEETKRKISETKKNQKAHTVHSEEARAKMSIKNREYLKRIEETVGKMSLEDLL